MGASFSAELLKLRKRPAVWVLAVVWLLFVAALGYFLNYLFISNAPDDALGGPGGTEALIATLLPENLLSNLLPGFSTVGGPVALILGALVFGSEYGWGTLKTVLTQRPGRLPTFGGKLLALGVILVALVLLAFAVGAASSFAIARLEDAALDWPAPERIVEGAGAAALIFAVWAMLGALLATLFRNTALAIGLGLVYALALEAIVFNLPIQSDAYETARKASLGQNSSFLANSFVTDSLPQGLAPPDPLVGPTQAALVLAAYVVAFVLLTALLLWRRDVT